MIFAALKVHSRFFPWQELTRHFQGPIKAPNVIQKEEWLYKNNENLNWTMNLIWDPFNSSQELNHWATQANINSPYSPNYTICITISLRINRY